MGQVPFPSSHLDLKGSVTEQIGQQQGNGKAAEMAAGDLIRMWRPLVPGAMVQRALNEPSPSTPLPSPLLSSTALPSTHVSKP